MPYVRSEYARAMSFQGRSQSGFTLIEFAIVMTIGALLLSSALGLYADHVKKQKIETTYKRIFEANTLMAEAINVQGRYFCPADPNLSPADANYGREVDDCDTLAAGCTSGATNGVCVGNGISSGLVNNRVVIGMFPFKTFIEVFERERATVEQAYAAVMANPDSSPETRESLRKAMLSMRSIKSTTTPSLILDGWGNQFTYMVSAALTNTETVKKTSGSVEVIMDLGPDGILGTADDVAGSSKGVHFALISHGENGNGARRRNGTRRVQCDAGLTSSEQENCDIDGQIVRVPVSSNAIDDVIVYNVHTAEVLWEKVACDTDGNGTDESFCLKNKNPGNVGVALASATIEEKLTVGGNMRAENVESDQICDATGSNCFSPSLIGGTAMNRCPDHASPNRRYVAERIANNQIVCREIELRAYNQVCPTTPGGGRQLVKGYDAGGGVICSDPCREDDQYRTQACPGAGMTGSINLTAHYSCATRTWSSWGEVSNNCSVACVSGTEQKSGPCPAGHSGTITYERARTCPGAWGGWVEISRTCAAPPDVCQSFNLELYSNCDPTYVPTNTTQSCPGGRYAVNENSSGVMYTCGVGTPTMATAITTSINANCQDLAVGQSYKSSGCP